MAVSSISTSATMVNLQSAQAQSQIGLVKKANDLQAQQVQDLLQAQAQAQAQQVQQQQQSQQIQPAEAAGKTGGKVDTYA